MGKTVLMQGNEACVEGALAAGMRLYAGYPITPSTEIAELSALRLPQEGGKFIQMEDEIASIACAIGASVAGVKAMTATSGPGFSLKQENIGYACLAEIPMVIVDVQRCGPSTGMPTSPSQGDVMMARWGTHGDHPIIVISPSSVRETYTLAVRCFNLSEKYRTPVIFLIVAAVLNIGLDLFFIICLHWGVFGAAFATVLSQAVSGVLCLFVIIRKFDILHLKRSDWVLDASYVRNLLIIGLPMGLQYSITAIGSVILQTAVNTLGSGAVAAMTAGSRISMFMVCPFDALGSTMATYGGQNVGAGKYDRLASGMKSAIILAAVYSAAILVVIIFLARPLIYLFIDPSDSANITQVVAQARQFLITNTCFYMLLSLVNIVRFLIQGMGFSGFAVFAGVFEMIARALIGLIFVPIFGFTAAWKPL